MPLPQGKLLASEETQMGVSTKFEQAMRDLAIKGERQRAEKAKKEAAERAQEVKEKLAAPQKARLQYQKEAQASFGSISAAEHTQEDEEYEAILDEDAELDKLRHARLEKMKKARDQFLENKSKGHGEYEEIMEDQFLKTVLASKFCVIHFYHDDFERCKIMDHHLKKIARGHVETRFARINADKARFFVEKLGVRTLPTVVFFEDGKAMDRLLGFQGLSGDEFKTRELEERIGITGAIKMEKAFYEEAVENSAKSEQKQGILGFDQGYSSDDLSD